jgi:hypothetical protein
MVEFKRETTHPACIWNAQKKRAIKFVDGICKTEDEFEIQALTKAGYTIVSKAKVEVPEEVPERKEIPKKKPLRKLKPVKKDK